MICDVWSNECVFTVCVVDGWVGVTTVCTMGICMWCERMMVIVHWDGFAGLGNASPRYEVCVCWEGLSI